ncbi:MAG TPA: gamma-glutamyltransferase [Rhizomicrobium sp.]|nr:gamma-glutamyltransferase [Rhizomicrobium sp.]
MLPPRLLALFAAPALFLGGCQTISALGDHTAATLGLADDVPATYTASEESRPVRSGIAVSDEPLAARAGAAALAAQGDAVDAVTTMFFAMTATYPVAAGLGGGGICLVRDASGQVTEFDFLARSPRGGGAYAVPGVVRGFADMQKAFGALPWQRVVAPGEAYAATGFPISQALSVRLGEAQNVIRLDASLAAEFLDESGQPRAAGGEARNAALGQTLSQIRLNGADGFYKGAVAQRIAAYTAAQGGAVSAEDMAATVSRRSAARVRNAGGLTTYIPGAGTGAGLFAGTLLDNLMRQRNVAAAAGQALGTFGVTSLPRDMGSTGFAAVDANGQAASCAVTLNGPFGSGRTAGDTGVQLAANPAAGQAGLAAAFLVPVIAINGNDVALAGAGAGGPNGAAAALNAVVQTAGGRQPGRRGDVAGTGAAPFDTVNMISCNSESCVALTDPGAHGMGAVAEAATN